MNKSGGRWFVVGESTKDLWKSVALSCVFAIPIGLVPLLWAMETATAAASRPQGEYACPTREQK